jgi:hypothetical protein
MEVLLVVAALLFLVFVGCSICIALCCDDDALG